MKKNLIIAILAIFVSTTLLAQDSTDRSKFCSAFTENIPVQSGGRVKPYYVLAKDTIKFLTGKSKYNNENAIDTFCQLMFQGKAKQTVIFPIKVEHVDEKKLLGLKDKDYSIPFNELMAKKDLIRSEIMRLKENNSYKKALTKLFNRLQTVEGVKDGNVFTVYIDHNGKSDWMALSHFYSLDNQALAAKIKASKSLYDTESSEKTYMTELSYSKANLFSYALLASLVGIFLVVLLKSLKYGVALSFIALGIETYAMYLRVMISGRAPITNMYETVMFSGFGALAISLIIVIFKREKIFLIAGLSYNILCLFMMMFANGMLDGSISPLVPVLRDNFWLSTHVTTIILSYAALALSWIVANITLVKSRFSYMSPKESNYYLNLNYLCIQVGTILLAAGIILGGIWADYSWGRFWGWDPKETWSLIVFLYYMVLLHGKQTKWINNHRFVVLSSAGFMTVMMAWFGVNYILASGLHSYGFSQGGAIFLGSFFAVQIAVILICIKKKEKKS